MPLPASDPLRAWRARSHQRTERLVPITSERQGGGQRAERVDHRRGGVGLHRLQLERQRVERAHGLRAAGELVVGQGEAEQRDADQRRQHDRQDDVAEGLAGRGAEVARGLLEALVEAVEDREHDQQAEGQRPGEVRARGPSVPPGRARSPSSLEQRQPMPSETTTDGMIRLATAT